METWSGPKVRLVKCPKCLEVLPEVEDVPVYQCGSCFIILQTKQRSINANGTSSAQATGTIQDCESQPVSEYKGSSSSSHVILPSSGEFLMEHEVEKDQNHNAGGKLSDRNQTRDIQLSGTSDGYYEQNEGENTRFEANDDTAAVAAEPSSDLRRGSRSNDQEQPVAGNLGQEADHEPALGIVITCPDEEEQSNYYHGHLGLESTDDRANKTSSAYDGSVSSSSYGKEDQIPDSQMHVSPSADENERSVGSEEKLRKGKLLMQGCSQDKEQQTSTSSVLSKEKLHKWDWNRYVELGGHPWNRNHEFSAHLPLYYRGPFSSGAYEHGSPSYASLNELHSHPHVQHSLQMPQYGAGGISHIPAYNEHEAFQRIYNDVSYVRHKGGRSWGHTNRFSGIRFSREEVMNRRHRVGQSSFYSGQSHSLYSSYHGSPQRQIEPPGCNPRWSREMVSDVEDRHRHGSRKLQTYMRERQLVAKRHLQPVAGGAPFVICYQCSETMQLPVDFLIFKSKYHFLRCSNCNNVLRFSLQETSHLVPAVRYTQATSSHNVDASKHDNSASGSCRDKVMTKPEKMRSSGKK